MKPPSIDSGSFLVRFSYVLEVVVVRYMCRQFFEVPYSQGTISDGYFGNLTRRQPPDVQVVVKPLIAELRAKSYDDLIILKAEANPCELLGLLDCHDIDPKTVKQYIEAAFGYRQFIETTEISRRYNYISFASMIISLISLAAVIAFKVVEFRNSLPKP